MGTFWVTLGRIGSILGKIGTPKLHIIRYCIIRVLRILPYWTSLRSIWPIPEFYGTRFQSGSFSLINVGSGLHCLRSYSLFLPQSGTSPSSHTHRFVCIVCECAFTRMRKNFVVCIKNRAGQNRIYTNTVLLAWNLPTKQCIQTHMFRVGQNRIYTPYMAVYLATSLPKIPCICTVYIWSWTTLMKKHANKCKSLVTQVRFAKVEFIHCTSP